MDCTGLQISFPTDLRRREPASETGNPHSGAMELRLVMLGPGPKAWLLEFQVSACHLEREDQLNCCGGEPAGWSHCPWRIVGLDLEPQMGI